jgi:hypothetical protein
MNNRNHIVSDASNYGVTYHHNCRHKLRLWLWANKTFIVQASLIIVTYDCHLWLSLMIVTYDCHFWLSKFFYSTGHCWMEEHVSYFVIEYRGRHWCQICKKMFWCILNTLKRVKQYTIFKTTWFFNIKMSFL